MDKDTRNLVIDSGYLDTTTAYSPHTKWLHFISYLGRISPTSSEAAQQILEKSSAASATSLLHTRLRFGVITLWQMIAGRQAFNRYISGHSVAYIQAAPAEAKQ